MNEHHSDSRDAVAELLRRTGPPTPIEPERTARVHAAVEDAWRASRRASTRRRRRRAIAVGMGLAAAAALAIVLGTGFFPTSIPAPSSTDGVGVVASVSGFVRTVAPGSAPRGLAEGDSIEVDVRLDTGAARAALRLANGATVRLDTGTRVTLRSSDRLVLERGGLYIDADGADIVIETPFGVARDIGTRYEVRVDEAAVRVRVRDGIVELARDGAQHRAEAGTELTIDEDGTVSRASVAAHGTPWQWTLAAAPAFPLEGATLEMFLSWLEAESGWQIQFANPELATAAAGVALHGPPIVGIDPDQALEQIMAITGWTHQRLGRVVEIDDSDSRERFPS